MNAKKIVLFFCLFAYLVGAFFGTFFAISKNEAILASCIIVLAVMAFPTAKKMLDTLRK